MLAKTTWCLLTPSRAGLPVNAGLNDNTALPNAGLPDNTISIFWDNFANGSASLGTNDNVWTGVFGTAPNRQFYVKYYSYETGGRSFSYGHLVLEEGTNNIYMIDNYMGGTLGSMTIGVQKDTATAVQVAGSPNISPIVTSSSWTTLEYYTFSPRLLSPNEAGISSVDAPSQPFAPGMQTVTATLTNHGTAALTSANIDWSANGVAQTGTTFSGSLAPNATTSINLGMYNFTGATNLSVWSSLPNGVADPFTANDTTMTTLVPSLTGGVYTIDGSQAASATNFVDFASAVTAMSGGISGAVTFNVAAGTYNEQVSIGSIIGSSDTNTITINGASAATTILTHDKTIRNSTLNLDGTSDITIKNMTIAATGGTDSWAIHIWNDANDVTIDSNIISTPVGTTSDVAGIMVSGTETSDNSTADVDDLIISNNTVTGGERGITIYGNFSSTARSQNLTIHNNDIQNADDNGLYITGYNNVTITDNYVDGLTNNFSDGMYSSDLENFTITGNRFKGGDNGLEANDYNFDNTVTTRSLIANNMFIGGDDGLYLDDCEDTDVFHNSCVGADYGVYVNDDANVDFRNNIFMSDGGDIAYYSLDASSTVTLDYNLYYTTGATLAKFGTPTYADLAAFQAGQTALNVNSVSGDPVFLDPTADLHAAGTTANDAGDNTVGITVDYDGDTRPLAPSTTVDIGADEFAPPSCAFPGGLASYGVTATTASLTWVENGIATQWEVEWDTAGYTAGAGRFSSIVTNDTTMISGLMAQTTYDWYVRAICTGPTNSPWSAVSSFTTGCLPTAAPFNESFDGLALSSPYTDLPICWTPQVGPDFWDVTNGSTNSGFYLAQPSDHTTGSGNYMWIDASGDITGNMMETPFIDMSGLTTPYAGFWFASNNTNNATNHTINLDVWDGTSWVNVATQSGNFPGWVEVAGNIPAGVPTTAKFRIQAVAATGTTSSTYYQNDLGIDDFFVKEAPTCLTPLNLVASNIATTSADLGWTEAGTATLWEVEYGALGFTLGTGTRDTTSSNPYSISGLTSSTDYEYYVRAICGPADSSAFAGPESFTTAFQCPAGAICATYTTGDIPTDYGVSYPAPSSCPGSLSLVIPAGDQIDSISTFYDMTAAGGAWMSEQGSYLYSPTTMNFEASGNNGSGTSAGTFSYSRDGLMFANGATGTVAIEMHAERSWGGSGCATGQNKVDNGTWTVIAYHSPVPLAPISLPITWDNGATVDLTTIDFGGNTSTLVADPTNASNTVLQSIKGVGAQVWAGTTFGDSLATPIAFASGTTTIRAVVYSPTAGIEVRLKVEDKTNPAISVETFVNTTVANGWDTLSFNFSNNAPGTGAINFTNTYDKMSIFYNFGVSPAAAETFYVDYVEDVSVNAAPPVPAKAAIALPITWDDTANVNYSTIDFGGNTSTLTADPTNASNLVLQSIKGVGAQTWGGTTLGDSLSTAIPFSTGNTTIRAVVYSPTVGTPVRLKVEDYNNGAISVETEVLTTVANGWDTLNFDMSVQAPMTAAINFANTYNKMSIFYNFGTSPTAAETYYVDYVEFGNPPNVIGIPYTQNFDAFPAGNISSEGWTNSRGSSVPDWTAGGSTGSSGTGPLQDHTTGTGLFVYTETSGTTAGVVDTLSSPAVTFGATNTSIELKYYYHMHGSTMGDLQVWVDTNGVWDSLTTYVGQQQANQADPWMKGTHILNGYEGQQVTVHFLGVSGASFSSDMAVDDVTLDIPPSCIEPSSLVTTSIGADSAVLGWTENNAATTWEIEWGPVGFTPGTGTVVSANANPFTLSGLSNLTEYSWRVRSLCSPTDSSLWSVMSSFKTAFQCPAGAICNTYTAGDISTDDAVSYPAQSACPGSMDLIIPTGNRIDSVRSFYDMTAQNGAWMSEQESYLYSPTTMNIEPSASAGAGNVAGTMNYDRSGLTFANGGVDTVVVELHAIRTWSSAGNAGCSTFNNKVDNGTWTVVAYYSTAPPPPPPPPPSAPYYPIATINTEDATTGVADSLNVTCFTSGTVVGIDLDGNNGISFTISDLSSSSQEGMNIFNFNDVSNYVVTEGDSIMVRGTIGQFNGLTQLVPDSIMLISTGATLPVADVVTNLDETTESKWLSIPTSWVALNTSGGGSSNVDLTNGIDTITMRIDADTDVNDSLNSLGAIIPGDTICGLLGIGGQFDNTAPRTSGYQIFPMRWSDLTICRFVPPFVAPYYPIGTINTEDATTGVADSLNVTCFTSGIVAGVDLDGNAGINFTIIDMASSSQEGIVIFNFVDVNNYVVTEGDSIMVRGYVDQYNGLTQIRVDSISVLATGIALPAPIAVTDLDETTEAKWLSLTGNWVSLSTSGAGSSNLDLTNGTDTIIMRIDSDTDVNDSLTTSGMPIIPGDTICGLLGIGGQFDGSNPFTDGYQIFPMRWSDLTICRLSTGINDAEAVASEFKLVPNPTNGLFEIRSNGFNNATINISIRDISGRLISSEIVNNANGNFTKSFDLNEESAGIYFITIIDGESIINEKLILK